MRGCHGCTGEEVVTPRCKRDASRPQPASTDCYTTIVGDRDRGDPGIGTAKGEATDLIWVDRIIVGDDGCCGALRDHMLHLRWEGNVPTCDERNPAPARRRVGTGRGRLSAPTVDDL